MLKLNSCGFDRVFSPSSSELGPAEEAGVGATPNLEDHASGDTAQGQSGFSYWVQLVLLVAWGFLLR